MIAMTNKLLTTITNHSLTSLPFYLNQNINPEIEFTNLPIITKDMIIQKPMDFLSLRYVKLYEQGRLINKKTSGSTGKCLDVYWSHNDETLASLEVWKYRRLWYDVSVKDRYVTFHTTVYCSNRLIENDSIAIYRGNNLSLSKNQLTQQTVSQYFDLISEFKASWILTQPSVLQLLLKYASLKDLHVLNRIKYIELAGEFLAVDVVNYFKSVLPNVKFANMYGTTETGSVALECPCGHMHILQNAKVEVLDGDYCNPVKTEGNIVLSTLKNYAMPLLRYSIGDVGRIIHDSKCQCGFIGDDIEITVGRQGDIIYSPDGNDKTCYSLLKAVEFVNDEFASPITQFNFVQNSPTSLYMYLNIKPSFTSWKKTIESALYDQLAHEFPFLLEIKIIFDGDFNFITNNKVKFFERKYNREESKI